ncbi:MAG: hypothetical protein ACHP8A_01810, partial [Terriglobales bacterium]
MRIRKVVLLWVAINLGLLPCFSQSNSNRQQQIQSHSRKAAEYLNTKKAYLEGSFLELLAPQVSCYRRKEEYQLMLTSNTEIYA